MSLRKDINTKLYKFAQILIFLFNITNTKRKADEKRCCSNGRVFGRIGHLNEERAAYPE